MKARNLVVLRVYHREVIRNMIDSSLHHTSMFLWKLFLKYEVKCSDPKAYNEYLEAAFNRQTSKILARYGVAGEFKKTERTSTKQPSKKDTFESTTPTAELLVNSLCKINVSIV
jgi:hypothetical protein